MGQTTDILEELGKEEKKDVVEPVNQEVNTLIAPDICKEE